MHVTTFNLTTEEQAILESLATGQSRPGIQRRAQILLLYNQGIATQQVAAQVRISHGRALYWRRQFSLRGMDIFPSRSRRSNPDERVNEQPGLDPIMIKTSGNEPGVLESPDPGEKALPGKSLSVATTIDLTPSPAGEVSGPEGPGSVPPFPQPMVAPGILPTDPLAEAGRKIWLFQFAEMLRHEEGTRQGEDIEALHDMRVATRRMRAAFEVFNSAFKPKALKPHLKGLRAVGRALGSVRDMDVFMEKARSYLDTLPEDQHSGLDPLLAIWELQRDSARTAMLTHLDSDAYQHFKQSFNHFLHSPGKGILPPTAGEITSHSVREAAPVLIYARLAGVTAFESELSTASLERLHALRIEFKKLRYSVEYFREVLGVEAKAVINELKVIQDHLGDLHDADVATQLLAGILQDWDHQQPVQSLQTRLDPQPVAAYLADRYRERHRLMVTFPQAWERFCQPEFRRNLALAISAL